MIPHQVLLLPVPAAEHMFRHSAGIPKIRQQIIYIYLYSLGMPYKYICPVVFKHLFQPCLDEARQVPRGLRFGHGFVDESVACHACRSSSSNARSFFKRRS